MQGDPYKTLFVTRISYDVSERKLKKEFERYGPIKRIRMVYDKFNTDKNGSNFIFMIYLKSSLVVCLCY